MASYKLTRDSIEREIAGAKAAVRAHKEGALINQLVLEAFEARLKTLPPAKKKPKKIHIGVR